MNEQSAGSWLGRHVPPVAVEWIRDTPQQTWRVVDGSLCFADISGFTALTEQLAAHGRIGAEELVQTLSHVFGSMLEVATDRDGQLLKFSGDALLLLFDGDDHARQAAASAVEMRHTLRQAAATRTAVGRLKLSMSVGIGSGDINLFLVGAPNRELLVTGPVAAATLGAEKAAAAGQILVTQATADRLPAGAVREHDDHLRLVWRRAQARPRQAPGAPVLDRVEVETLLPADVAAALANKPEPGHRVATMAFIAVSGTDRLLPDNPNAAADALDASLQTIQALLRAEDVALLAVDAAVDGVHLMCAAGAPLSSEDDEGRVLRAMRRITTSNLPLSVRAGVNRGPVFAAEVGTDWRAAYSAMGDTTNTAARIMATAPVGCLYSHPSVLEHARTRYETRPVGHFELKGKASSTQLYDVGPEIGARSEVGTETLPLVGRHEELSVLRDAVAAVTEGRGGVVTVYGTTGVGKSRLVREALREAPALPLVLLRAEPSSARSPYRPLRDPMRVALGIDRLEPDEMATALAQAVGRIEESLVPLAPLLGTVAHVEVPTTPAAEMIGSAHRLDRTADLVVRVLEESYAGPLVVVAEDAHWLDESSAHLLGRIERETERMPWLLVVVRRESLDGFVPSLGAEVAVEPIDDLSMRALVLAATDAAPLRTHEIDTIVARAAGSPAFVEQWTRAARSVATLDAVPDSMHAAIATQIDSVDPVARRALAYASVLGRSFRRDLLVELLAAEGSEMDDATLVQLEPFLDSDDQVRLRFRNGLVRDVAYEGLAYRTRTRLHGAAGETLERLTGGVGPDVDVLADHYWRAGDHLRTWRYSSRAAARARNAAANADAAIHLERALEAARWLDVDDDERLDRWLELGDARDRAGMLDGALDAYRAAARLVPDEDHVAKADLLLRRASTHERAGAYPVAMREATRARSVLDGVRGHRAATARADALGFAALVRQRQQHPAEALSLAERAAGEADDAGALAAQARAYNVISWAATMLGRADAEVSAQRALALYEELGDLVGQADMANNLGVQAYYAGRWDETLALYERSRDACVRVGNVLDAAESAANIGEVLVNQGRLDEAETVLSDASRVMRASGHRLGAVFADLHVGRLIMARGDLAAAEEVLARACDQFLSLGRPASAYETSLHLADCIQRSGRPEHALDILGRAARLTGDDVSIFDPARDRIRAAALARAGRVGEATATLEQGIATARGRGLEYELSLMLADAAGWPDPVQTGTDEPAAIESDRLAARLGVLPPGQRQSGSPAPS